MHGIDRTISFVYLDGFIARGQIPPGIERNGEEKIGYYYAKGRDLVERAAIKADPRTWSQLNRFPPAIEPSGDESHGKRPTQPFARRFRKALRDRRPVKQDVIIQSEARWERRRDQ